MRAPCALAAALAATLALAACGGSDESPLAEPPPAATTEEPATTGEPATTAETETAPPATTATEPAGTEPPETGPAETETEPPATTEDRFDVDVFIQVAEGARIGGTGRVEAKKGDRVRIEIAVDAAQEFHLHGYELSRSATPEKPAVFRFEAELEGIFELESHLSEAVIVNLLVEP